ncbi:MAG: serine protease [Planctomycetota bacterium]
MIGTRVQVFAAAFAAALVFPSHRLNAQTSPNGRSTSLAIPEITVPALDRIRIAAEDSVADSRGSPPRFAIPFPVSLSPDSVGAWDRIDAVTSRWRLRVRAPGASHVNLGFGEFHLPGRARLTIASTDGSHRIREFTDADNSPARELWTPVVAGDDITIELRIDSGSRGRLALRLSQVGSGYRFFGAGPAALAYQTTGSGACNVDVVCPAANGWQSEIDGVAAYSTGGTIFCTGFLVNNTSQDARPFFMTAWHCGIRSSNAASLVTYWNYENTSCGGPDNGTLTRFTTGATYRAGWSTSDFTLVELAQAPNPAWGVSYLGWDRSGQDAPSAAAIHHPNGDPKKISFENDATTTTSYSSNSVPGDGTHIRVIDWDQGTTEPGSSGSPLFDDQHRVIGQLHGGAAACGNNQSDWFGKFARSWTGGGTNTTRLSNWLDASGSGRVTLDTLAGPGRATATNYGAGCGAGWSSFAELFPNNGFDLAGSASAVRTIVFVPTPTGYRVEFTSSNWITPAAPDLRLGDDALSAALALPFAFRFHGTSVTQIRIASNGFVWLDGNAVSPDFSPSIDELVTDAPRLAPLWMDLDPQSGGSVHFDALSGRVVCTWLDVPEFGQTTTNSLQCELSASGRIEFRYRSCSNVSHAALTGASPGLSVQRPTSLDLSAALPIELGPDRAALTLDATTRPVLGSTQALMLRDLAPTARIAVFAVGLTRHDPGIDLTSLGMPGCRQHCSVEFSATAPITAGTATLSFAIPSLPSLAGTRIFASGFSVTPGANTMGILASNGVELQLDRS